MDFSWPEEYKTFKEQVYNFAKSELNEDLIERDANGSFSRSLWKKCASFGILKLAIPKQYGGDDEEVDITKGVLAMEALGKGCKDNGLAMALNAQMWTVQIPLAEFGTPEQCNKYLPKMSAGEIIGAHALTEPEAGSDIHSLQTTAEKTDKGYILNGEKCLISLAPIADFFLIFANVRKDMNKWGITAFLVDKGTPGLTIGEMESKMGLRTVPIGKVSFKNCLIPIDNRLGGEGAGFSIMNHSLEYDRCCILASQLGAMQRQLNETLAYTKERKQFGKQIIDFQSVSNRLANMRLRIETSQLLLYKVAWMKKNNQSAMMEAAILKLYLSESFVASSMDAVRCAGGRGYLTAYEVERNLRDAMGGVLYAGTSDIQRNIISKLMEVE